MDLEPQINPKKPSLNFSIIISILIGAWIIGMSILAAGWLITRELAKTNQPLNDQNLVSSETTPIAIEVPEGFPILGDNNAPVTIVEFADFQCPYCGEWQKTIFPEIKSKYIDTGKARFVFMNYAFLGPESYRSAEAALCAKDQNKFWEYHDELYENQNGENEQAFSDPNLKRFAVEVGLNETAFNSCLDGNKYQSEVNNALTVGSNYGVQSTPTVFINGYKYEGVLPFAQYEQIIESELSK